MGKCTNCSVGCCPIRLKKINYIQYLPMQIMKIKSIIVSDIWNFQLMIVFWIFLLEKNSPNHHQASNVNYQDKSYEPDCQIQKYITVNRTPRCQLNIMTIFICPLILFDKLTSFRPTALIQWLDDVSGTKMRTIENFIFKSKSNRYHLNRLSC